MFVEETIFSPLYILGTFVQKGEHSCMNLYLSLLFGSTGLHICFCARDTDFFKIYFVTCYIAEGIYDV
jgi:hypothetical protein